MRSVGLRRRPGLAGADGLQTRDQETNEWSTTHP